MESLVACGDKVDDDGSPSLHKNPNTKCYNLELTVVDSAGTKFGSDFVLISFVHWFIQFSIGLCVRRSLTFQCVLDLCEFCSDNRVLSRTLL